MVGKTHAMYMVYTYIMDPLVLEMAQKVVKSVDNITTKSYNLAAFVQQPAKTAEYKPKIRGRLTCFRKQPRQKQTGELLAKVHAHMDCLIMYLWYGSKICVLKWCA